MSESAAAEVAAGTVQTADVAPEAGATTETAPESWLSSFPDDLKENPTLQRFDSVESLARGLVETKALVGKKGVIHPGENATPDQLNDYYTQLGRPETVEGYGLDEIEIPEVLQPSWNQEGVNAVVSEMFAKGASKEVVQTAVAKMAEIQAAGISEANQTIGEYKTKAAEALQKEWGGAYKGKLEAAQGAFREAAALAKVSKEDVEAIIGPDGGRMADNPAMLRLFAAIGEAGGEHSFVGEASRRTGMTPAEAMQRVQEIEADKGYVDAGDPRHTMLIEQHLDALRYIHPDEEETG